MNFESKLDSLREEIITSLCSINEFPDNLLPHIVFVEETEKSLSNGNTFYCDYNLLKIFPDKTCILENQGTGEEDKRFMNEINIDSLLEVWNFYKKLSGKNEERDVTELLKQMELIATNLITTQYITDFKIHDTVFIHDTKAEIPFVWFIYHSGTHIYALNNKNEIKNFIEKMNYFEKYTNSEFCLYKYDGNNLFPVFHKVLKKWAEEELSKYSF